ncbi:monocarboxylate transporter 12-B-like [Xiphophorus couchianus]|uniref:monocarboxylate transporter 12-B-like n=1 Tax=Xiphophorus couchianus TaxID=32473 RepID=UPI001016F84E|nr:monocarboxylate transporter 12-B-like [Xiphophorus couchianus]XP_027862945.1 monocarboxylate transporter 12-B-like [Xiphophorus couchianus]
MMAAVGEERLGGGRRASRVTNLPEGGWGWMVVASCFLATICIRAVTRCISMFFVEFQMYFERDYSTTAWIHSMIDCTTMLCAPLGSFLGNRLSCRVTVFLGGLLSSAGLVLSSFASSLEFLYASLGILTGLGYALSYTTSIAMVGKYFNERKALAFGIALSGSGIGTFLLAPAVQLLIEHYSWRGALLILGGFVSNLCVCGALMRPLEQNPAERMWESNIINVEKACMTAVLQTELTEPVTTDWGRENPKQQQIHGSEDNPGLVIINGTYKNFGLEKDQLQQRFPLLPSPKPTAARLMAKKMADYLLLSNNLETIREETGLSGPTIPDSSRKDKKTTSSNTWLKANEKRDNSISSEVTLTDDYNEAIPIEPLVSSQPLSRDQSFFFKAKEEFGFLWIPRFLVLSVSFVFLAFGCSVPVVYLVPYALSVGVEHQHAAFLMSIFGVSGIVGNITFGWITDRTCLKRHRLLSYIVTISMEGLCCVFLPLLHSFQLLVLFSVLYGYFDGAYVALIPVLTSDTVGSTHLASALGVVYFLHAIPYLVSPPIGGWFVDQTGNYALTFFISGASLFLSSLVLVAASLATRLTALCKRTLGQGKRSRETCQPKTVPVFSQNETHTVPLRKR